MIQVEHESNLGKLLAASPFGDEQDLFLHNQTKETRVTFMDVEENRYSVYTNEFWTSKQRQGNSLHEIAYRACFKPQLPNLFIKILSTPDDLVYDPFAGRGTTAIEAAILNRNVVSNDINPLSSILTKPRLHIPDIQKLEKKLDEIKMNEEAKADIDLSMFYHFKTEAEIVSLREYLRKRKKSKEEDEIDAWIRMIATNRLTGHSSGFFSVYSLPPNQAIFPERQTKINKERNQKPEYRDTKSIILRKTKTLLRDMSPRLVNILREVGKKAIFLENDARNMKEINHDSIQLTVTSPPFLDVVQYADDNWLRCWFNHVDPDEVGRKITMARGIPEWTQVMREVFVELHRITKPGGYVAFEVGEVRNGKLRLEQFVLPLGKQAGFNCLAVMINEQKFTKTANIWGVSNNSKGTNTNRIVVFQKP